MIQTTVGLSRALWLGAGLATHVGLAIFEEPERIEGDSGSQGMDDPSKDIQDAWKHQGETYENLYW
ncbi:MAG: hypothetical protein H0V09_12015 [Gemmatimonadetes bacterium]|nr:hypothetical protein [Gemmatimonadota bacterium]